MEALFEVKNPFSQMLMDDAQREALTRKIIARKSLGSLRPDLDTPRPAASRPVTREPLPTPSPETLERARKAAARSVIENKVAALESTRAAHVCVLESSSYPEYHTSKIAALDKKLGALHEKLKGLE